MSAEEPLYCTHCGKDSEDGCACFDGRPFGEYCEICGVKPAPGKECWQEREDGSYPQRCETREESENGTA